MWDVTTQVLKCKWANGLLWPRICMRCANSTIIYTQQHRWTDKRTLLTSGNHNINHVIKLDTTKHVYCPFWQLIPIIYLKAFTDETKMNSCWCEWFALTTVYVYITNICQWFWFDIRWKNQGCLIANITIFTH